MATERVYTIIKQKEAPPMRVFSNLQKLVEELSKEHELPSYTAIQKRLYRARKRTGKAAIRIKNEDGSFLLIEVKDLE